MNKYDEFVLDFLDLIYYRFFQSEINSYTLQRNITPVTGIKRVLPPPRLEIDYNSDIITAIYDDFGRQVEYFEKVLKEKIPSEYLRTFNHNIKSVVIKKLFGEEKLGSGKAAAIYDVPSNSITLKYGCNSSIYHELLHLASSYYKDGVSYSGFKQHNYKKRKSIGTALSEGYTSLLTSKFFGDKVKNKSYAIFSFISSSIEEVIGDKKMESFYFTSNLWALVNNLALYVPRNEVIKFLKDTDDLFKTTRNFKKVIDNNISTINKANSIQDFLFKLYIAKLKKDNYVDNMGYDDLYKVIESIINDISFSFYNNKKMLYLDTEAVKYHLQDSVDVDDLIHNYFEFDKRGLDR